MIGAVAVVIVGIAVSLVDEAKRAMLRVFVTGGTFDKTYDEIRGRLSFGETHVPEMLRLGRSRVELTIETLMMIDSLDMTDADRAEIVARVCRVPRAADRGHARHGHDGGDGGRARGRRHATRRSC